MECALRVGHSIAVLHKVYTKVLDQTRGGRTAGPTQHVREWNEPRVIMLPLGDTH